MEKNRIYVRSGNDPKEMTKELLEICDLAGMIRDTGKRIGIKPNLVAPTPPELGATTHPEIVAGLLEYLQERGFGSITIMEGSWVGGQTRDAFDVCGYRELCERYNVPFVDAQKEKGIPTRCGDMEISICKCALDVDFMINVPVLKGHCQTRITCALKNMKGCLPNAQKRKFHAWGLHKPIAHLGLGIRQDFILVDNICGDLDFEDGGNPVEMNRIMAGCDPVLIDAFVCHLMQYEVDEVPYIRMAEELGVGSADVAGAEIILTNTGTLERMPRPKKMVDLRDRVEEVDSCSSCYASLIPALDRLKEEGILKENCEKICIGQGYRGKTGKLGVGQCTAGFEHHLKGCPPEEEEIYTFLKKRWCE